MTEEDRDTTAQVKRSDLPWFLGGCFTAAAMFVSLVIWVVTFITGTGVFSPAESSADLSLSAAVHLSILGAALGLLSGMSRSRALREAAAAPIDEEAFDEGGRRAEDRYIWAIGGTPSGRWALTLELVGIATGAAIGIASRSLTPTIIVFTALTTLEQGAYLWWLRRGCASGD